MVLEKPNLVIEECKKQLCNQSLSEEYRLQLLKNIHELNKHIFSLRQTYRSRKMMDRTRSDHGGMHKGPSPPPNYEQAAAESQFNQTLDTFVDELVKMASSKDFQPISVPELTLDQTEENTKV